eukprot:TRINITY_DN3785_c0_g2_i2.p2 TRINITY_DN3785_c0_g2~~TRINITY_DN3785_c0_g2_i2.p2  ORF type:complete len:140 (+),score=32.63 TRINITY_DN3785_c0_g2_i2:149-568(+)
MGHIGLTPQRIGILGGFRPQGRSTKEAEQIFDVAMELERAGAMAIVIECVPERLADVITRSLNIPTIGIGAGGKTSGQVLVFHDLTGMVQHPHHKDVTPRFCKKFSSVGPLIQQALKDYHDEVTNRTFPSPNFLSLIHI